MDRDMLSEVAGACSFANIQLLDFRLACGQLASEFARIITRGLCIAQNEEATFLCKLAMASKDPLLALYPIIAPTVW